MSDMVEIWHVKEGASLSQTTSYSRKEKYSDGDAPLKVNSAPDTEVDMDAGTDKTDKREGADDAAADKGNTKGGVAKGTGKSRGIKRIPGQPPSPAPKAKKTINADEVAGDQSLDEAQELTAQLKKAKQLKTRVMSVIASTSDVLQAVSTDPEWGWATEFVKGVRSAKSRIDGLKTKTAFWKTWMMSDQWEKEVQKTSKPQVILHELEQLKSFEDAVSDLEIEVSTLKQMGTINASRNARLHSV